MIKKSQLGRTMIEITMVLGLMGVLSVTGIYMYKSAMNDVRADGIIKDVLVRASQRKGNLDLNRSGVGKKLVYVPEYKKTIGTTEEEINTTKGRYGYSYEIDYSPSTDSIGVQIKGKEVTYSICNSLKLKLRTYKKGTFSKVLVIGGESAGDDILTSPCPRDISSLKFHVPYIFGSALERIYRGEGRIEPKEPILPNSDCPFGTSKSGTGEATNVEGCRCTDASAHWNGSACVACSSPEIWNSVTKICETLRECPLGSSESGTGEATNVEGCRCVTPKTHWSGMDCVCPAPKTHWDGEKCVCPIGQEVTINGTIECVQIAQVVICSSIDYPLSECPGNGNSLCSECNGKYKLHCSDIEYPLTSCSYPKKCTKYCQYGGKKLWKLDGCDNPGTYVKSGNSCCLKSEYNLTSCPNHGICTKCDPEGDAQKLVDCERGYRKIYNVGKLTSCV